jgi:hypothetical protein
MLGIELKYGCISGNYIIEYGLRELARCDGCTPVITATQEVYVEGSQSRSARQKVSETISQKKAECGVHICNPSYLGSGVRGIMVCCWSGLGSTWAGLYLKKQNKQNQTKAGVWLKCGALSSISSNVGRRGEERGETGRQEGKEKERGREGERD